MLRVLLCDDDELFLDCVKSRVEAFLNSQEERFEILAHTDTSLITDRELELCDALLQPWIDVVGPKKDPEFPMEQLFYDNQVIYTTYGAPGWQMTVNYADGSFTLSNFDAWMGMSYRPADRQTLTELPSGIQIQIPAEADFSYDGEQ